MDNLTIAIHGLASPKGYSFTDFHEAIPTDIVPLRWDSTGEFFPDVRRALNIEWVCEQTKKVRAVLQTFPEAHVVAHSFGCVLASNAIASLRGQWHSHRRVFFLGSPQTHPILGRALRWQGNVAPRVSVDHFFNRDDPVPYSKLMGMYKMFNLTNIEVEIPGSQPLEEHKAYQYLNNSRFQQRFRAQCL